MRATRLKFMLGAVAAFACQTATAAGCADDGRFALQPAIPIGPMTMRTHVVNTTACVQVTYATAATVGWTSIGFAQTPYMVNSPVKNVVVFDSASATTKLYLMASYESRNVPEQPGPMSITPVRGSVANGVISFTFERSLAAATEYDMALDPTGATCILWGYARRKWPDKHSDYGAVYITLSTSTLSDSDTIRLTDTPAIAAISFGIMVVLGLIVTYTTVGRGIVRKSVWAPRKHVSDVVPDPVTAGEAVIVLVYLGSMVVIALRVHRTFSDLDAKHLWCLIAGHVALQALVFLLLPVARGRHWEVAFGTSHDRVLKFHRWLGGFCVVATVVHLILNVVNQVAITDPNVYGPQGAVPLYGLLAFIAFASMALMAAAPIRRGMYEWFYYHHRVASVVGIVCVMLHSPVVQYTMIFPLAIYGASFVARGRGFFNTYHVTATAATANSVLLTLPPTTQTTQWAKNAHPCAYFWVYIPAVSVWQWHPFSSIVTRDGQSIAFCLKTMAPDGFVDRVVRHCSTTPQPLTILVGGPYGIPSLDLDKYNDVLLVAGGIGITPLASIINRYRHLPGTRTLHLYWVVRTPHDLLAAEDVMFPLPPNVKPTLYVSQATEGGTVASGGVFVPYVPGKPNMDELINTSRFGANKAPTSVAVIACGPAGLVQEAEWYSYTCGFDFHKEGFAF